jgi:hypothetical protein
MTHRIAADHNIPCTPRAIIRARFIPKDNDMRIAMRLLLLLFFSAELSLTTNGQSPVVAGLPGPMVWQNSPVESKVDQSRSLSITAGKGTDWFVSPMDGARRDNRSVSCLSRRTTSYSVRV